MADIGIPIPIVLDTDIGTDPDDLVALVLAATDPALDLRAVTTVNGDTQLRARIARWVLDLLGRTDVPVGAGATLGLVGVPNDHMPTRFGHEGDGFDLTPTRFPPAEEVLTTAIRHAPEPVVVCAIGAQTNIARTLLNSPGLVGGVRAIHAMGGCFGPIRVDGRLVAAADFAEHNVSGDPLALTVVLASPVPLRFVPIDATARLRLTEEHHGRIAGAGNLGRFLADQMDRFLAASRERLVRRRRPPSTAVVSLHDPVVISALVDPGLCEAKTAGVCVTVRPGGLRTRIDRLGRPVEIVHRVEADRFFDGILAGIGAAGRRVVGQPGPTAVLSDTNLGRDVDDAYV